MSIQVEMNVDEFTKDNLPTKAYLDDILSYGRQGTYETFGSAFELNTYKKIYVVRMTNSDSELIGVAIGAVYKPNTMRRCAQWDFGSNRKRELWIDNVWVCESARSQGLGKQLVAKLEELLSKHLPDGIAKPNIYVLAPCGEFFLKCKYRLICTPDHKDDDDYPDSFMFGVYGGLWYAKNILNPDEFPADEVLDNIPLYFATDYGLRPLYASYFSEPAPSMDVLTQWLDGDDYSKVTSDLIDRLVNPNDAKYYRDELRSYQASVIV